MKVKRILHVVSSLSTSSGVMGVIMNYYRYMDREKLQFDFLYFSERVLTYKEEITKLGGNYYFCDRPSFNSYTQYKRFFEENAHLYSAVHLHEVYLNFLILPLAREKGIKHLITHAHSAEFSDRRINAIRNRILCIPIKRNATHYFACSKAAGMVLYGKKYVDTGKVKIINNAIHVPRFRYNPTVRKQLRKDLRIEDKFVVGHVGRFSVEKNHTFLIEIFAEIMKRKKDSILLLIGDGQLFEDVKKHAAHLGVEDSVLFLGAKSNVECYLQAMDVFVLPSLFEGLPIVGIEAQTSGLPCFFSDSITEEVKLIPSVFFKSIKEHPGQWADEICKVENDQRVDTANYIIDAGFDIKESSEKLQNFYIGLN